MWFVSDVLGFGTNTIQVWLGSRAGWQGFGAAYTHVMESSSAATTMNLLKPTKSVWPPLSLNSESMGVLVVLAAAWASGSDQRPLKTCIRR